ncbi:MAG: hypothetical protein DMF51_05445 [Acidobacteria bacterium]|nr:MAG: hypothetical protein DMF51_05445 [Acidobacteriota bacterium]
MNSVRNGWVPALLLGALLLATAAPARAQAERPLPRRMGPGPRARPEEVRRAVQEVVIARMREALHLTEEQEAKVVPRFTELMQTRTDHAMKRRAAMARLRLLLLDGTAGDQEIARALREVRAIDEDYLHREGELRGAIDGSLTPRQQGRLVFFEGRIRRVVQRRMQEAMGAGPRRGLMAPGRRPQPPDDGFDLQEDEP